MTRIVMNERWRRLLRIVNETFAEYETGVATLRQRVLMDFKRKLSDSGVPTTRTRSKRSGRAG
jgi:hypothetical protein